MTSSVAAKKEVLEIPVISDTIRKLGIPLSPCVRANGFLFISGLPGIDLQTGGLVKGDIEAQTAASIEALKHTLEHVGSSLDNIVKTTVFCANVGHFDRINKVYAQYFREDAPARSCIAIGSWPLEFDIEIEAVALA